MKQILFALMMLVASSAYAEDYHYMTFVLTNGEKASAAVDGLSMSVSGNKLTVGDKELVIENLQKMYFSVNNESTTAIDVVNVDSNEKPLEIYDLQGNRVKDTSTNGIYIVKTNRGTYKMTVR